MKRWARWSKLTLMGVLLAELLLPSPSAIGARWSARFSLGLDPMSTALSAAMATQDIYTPDLLGIDGVVGTAVGVGADGAPVVLVYTARPGVLGVPAMLDSTPVRTEVTGEFWALGDGLRSHLPLPPPRVWRPAKEGTTRSTGGAASLARCRSVCPEASRT